MVYPPLVYEVDCRNTIENENPSMHDPGVLSITVTVRVLGVTALMGAVAQHAGTKQQFVEPQQFEQLSRAHGAV